MKHIIWTSDISDEHIEAYSKEYPDMDKERLMELIWEENSFALECERDNLNIAGEIIAFTNIGRWNGRFLGYKEYDNLSDILYSSCDDATWYVDKHGSFRMVGHHHDGTNCVEYRVVKPTLSDRQRDNFYGKLYDGTLTQSSIKYYTHRLGDIVGQVYGWKFPNAPNVQLKRAGHGRWVE